MVPETDARALLKGDRIAYWIGVGAQPSDKCAVLIKKYGKDGVCLEAQKAAIERLAAGRKRNVPVAVAAPAAPAAEEAPAAEAAE